MVVNERALDDQQADDPRVEFLRRSLADLEREHDAGDLDDADYEHLRADYVRELVTPTVVAPPAAPRRPLPTLALSAVFLVVVAIVAGVLVARSTGRREGGQSATGNAQSGGAPSEVVVTTTTLPADLARCSQAEPGEAIACFTTYTDDHPGDPRGWTEFGTFVVAAGIAADDDQLIGSGERFLQQALAVDADYVPARVHLATVYLRTGRAEEARAELAVLEEATIPPDYALLVDVLREELGEPAGASATTTTP